MSLDYLLDYCASDTQREVIETFRDTGSVRATARNLGKSPGTIGNTIDRLKARAARNGHAPGHWNNGVAAGYRMGKVTVQRGPEGAVERVWERQSPDGVDWAETFQAVLEGLSGGIKRAEPTPAPEGAVDFLAVIPIGDPHFGGYSWAGDTGESYDLSIARSLHINGVKALLDSIPVVKRIVLLNLGDMFDSNDSKNRTPRSGHIMDPSGTFNEIVEAVVHSMMEMIDLCLERAEIVEIPTIEGNHDPEACALLSAFIYGRYGNNPRVICRLKPYTYWYLRWEKVLLGSHHGHGCKPENLPSVMAVDRREDWGQVKHCYWLIGHFHHSQLLGKGYTGAKVEGFNTLAANNKHHHDEGYRSDRSICAILYHPQYGEWHRSTRRVEYIQAMPE